MRSALATAAAFGLVLTAQATTVGIPAADGSYALWDTFTDANPGYPALEFSAATPTVASTSDFSALLSASMGGSVTGSGDRIYNGVGAGSGAFRLSIDGTATSPLTDLILVLKMTPPSSGTIQDFFTVTLDGHAATGSYLGTTGETIGGGEMSIITFSWTGLSIAASENFVLSLTSPADGHVSVDSIQLSPAIVPEPSVALLGGLGMLGMLRRRRC